MKRKSFRKVHVDVAEYGVYFQDTPSGETTQELPEDDINRTVKKIAIEKRVSMQDVKIQYVVLIPIHCQMSNVAIHEIIKNIIN